MKLTPPRQDEIGYAESLSCRDIGGSSVIVLEQPPATGQICSIVLKGSTEQLLDDLERAVDDGVNTFKASISTSPLSLPSPKATLTKAALRAKGLLYSLELVCVLGCSETSDER